jgi:uncharacterized OB-fold protein
MIKTQTLFETKIKDKDCDHDWRTLHFKFVSVKGARMFRGFQEIEFSYLYCPKCGSVAGEKLEG